MEVNKLYTLKANTEVFSIALQENIRISRDVIIKITNTIIDDDNYAFATIQMKFLNLCLSYTTGVDMSSFVDKTNGEICVPTQNLVEYAA